MADSRLSLEEYNKNTPPGWEPHLSHYTLRHYEEKLMLWRIMVQNTLQPNEIGPLVVGRLRNAAYRLAMKTKIVLADGTVREGAEAIALEAQPALAAGVLTGAGADMFPLGYPGSKSGLQLVLEALQHLYGAEADQLVSLALDRFFTLHRYNRPLVDFCTAFRIRYETAQDKGGLEINPVGKTHLFLTKAGLSGKFIDDIMLKVDGDRTQFQKIYEIILRTAKQHTNVPDEDLRHLLFTYD